MQLLYHNPPKPSTPPPSHPTISSSHLIPLPSTTSSLFPLPFHPSSPTISSSHLIPLPSTTSSLFPLPFHPSSPTISSLFPLPSHLFCIVWIWGGGGGGLKQFIHLVLALQQNVLETDLMHYVRTSHKLTTFRGAKASYLVLSPSDWQPTPPSPASNPSSPSTPPSSSTPLSSNHIPICSTPAFSSSQKLVSQAQLVHI